MTELQELVEVVSQFASRVAEKARQQGVVAGAVYVFVRTSPYRQNDRQHTPSVTVPLVRPSADTRVIVGTAVRAIREMYRPGFNYAKAGVILVDLRPEGHGRGTEHAGGALHQLATPLGYLVGMHVVLVRDLSNGLAVPQGFDCHLGLERR